MADDKVKLAGQRAAIREHIDKYKTYPAQHDKEFALKTIQNCQKQIKKLFGRHPSWHGSWEDTWQP